MIRRIVSVFAFIALALSWGGGAGCRFFTSGETGEPTIEGKSGGETGNGTSGEGPTEGTTGGTTAGGGGEEGGEGTVGARAMAIVSLTVTGVGNGVVSSDLGGIACDKEGGDCSVEVPMGTDITLTPSADAGYFFNGWRAGPCFGVGACTFTVNVDTTLRGSFIPTAFLSTLRLDGLDDGGASRNIWTIPFDGTPPKPITKLSNQMVKASQVDWSPDGNKFAYASNRNRTPDSPPDASAENTANIWVSNADGSGGDVALTHLTSAGSTDDVRWSPDGSRIAYISDRLFDLTDGTLPSKTPNLWVVNADGTGGDIHLTQLDGADNGLDISKKVSWSPDGTKLVYTARRSLNPNDPTTDNRVSNIWIVNADGSGGDQALTKSPGSVTGFSLSPQWSPDGTKIVFSSNINKALPFTGLKNGSTNIWVVNADGTGLKALTTNTNIGVRNSQPYWSPDGTTILFDSNRNLTDASDGASRNPAVNLWTIRADGTQLTHVTGYGQSDVIEATDWSPDGNLIIFQSKGAFNGSDAEQSDFSNLWEANPEGGELHPITTFSNVNILMPNNFRSGSVIGH